MVHTKTVGFQAPPIGAPIAPTDVLSAWVKVNVISFFRFLKLSEGTKNLKKQYFPPKLSQVRLKYGLKLQLGVKIP